ncbi:DNA repair protein RAD50 [Seminavis robusta]|uniref:DNA repair protein RAD50 n=1 Tax=Seminavis robusta TaxID=568900 RepID=A0A9N8E0V9_9STRA|nr:DNA repair protein RAD50 [Seminavis robusta]|eukprot:Sro536_g162200.1 DNA repair protein RAD50 (1389) ;mRNA; r:40752-45671
MASINKISIRGIRSFSPDAEEQVVEFLFPLTIISGANGCGKTTIIESLKFALSGSLPPGGGTRSAGQNFLCDPRGCNQSVVKGNIKLRFTNKAGADMVVIRSMELTQKKATMQFKQLDGVIRCIDVDTGERVSLSHKCGELDKQIPSLMGVSKAIMDYCLFVHQEESSWPLQESAIVKKRFDDIFDSTRYTKALESFRKTKKELTSQSKDIKAEVSGLKSAKSASVIFRKDLDDQKQSLAVLEEKRDEARQDKKDADDEASRLTKIIEKTDKITDRMKDKKQELAQLESRSETQKQLLETDLTEDSMEELVEKKSNFDKEMEKAHKKKNRFARQVESIKAEIESLQQEQINLNSDKGKLAAEKDAHVQRLEKRLELMKNVEKTFGLDLQSSMTQYSRLDDSFSISQHGADPSSRFSEEDMKSFFSSLEDKKKELQEELEKHKAKYRNEENECNSALQELEGNKKSFEKEKQKLATESKDMERKLQDLARKLGSKRTKKSHLDDFEEQMKQAVKDLEKLSKEDEGAKLRAELKSYDADLDSMKESIEKKETARNRLKSSARLQQRIDDMKDAAVQEASTLKESLEKQRRKLSSLKIALPDVLPDDTSVAQAVENIRASIDSKAEEAKEKANNTRKKMENEKTEVSRASASLHAANDTVAMLESKISKLSQGNKSVIGKLKRIVEEMKEHGFSDAWSVQNGDPQELRDWLEKQKQAIEDDDPQGIEDIGIIKAILRTLRIKSKQDGMCACCSRAFNDGEERKTMVETLRSLGKEGSPLLNVEDGDERQEWLEKKKQHDNWSTTIQKCDRGLLEYRSATEELAAVRDKMQQLASTQSTRSRELEKASKEASAAEEIAHNIRDLQEMAKRWKSDAARIEEHESSIEDKNLQLTAETAGTVGDTSLEQVESELDELREAQAGLYDKINKGNKKLSVLNEEISAAQSKASRLSELFRDKQKKFEEEQKAIKERDELLKRKEHISIDIEKASEQMNSFQQKIKAKNDEKKRIYNNAMSQESKLSKILGDFKGEMKHLQDISDQIERYNGNDQLEKIEADVAAILENIEKKKEEMERIQPILDAASKAVDDQARYEKVLQDNIDFLTTLDEISQIEDEMSKLKAQRDAVEGGDTAEDLLIEAQEKMQKSDATLARLDGRRTEIVEQIRNLQRKLLSEEYRDIDSRYRAELIKLETTLLAIKDIDSYAGALDKALLRFHGIKIGEINKIVKELWLLTYKGEDITNIELESGQDSRAAKSYNYRVVMTKGNTKMDMRGRCSAGQRVLASLVIRLALAETFGVHLGAMVLDEPTVNLDESNRKGLAIAMAQIIANRSKQANFQLVLITHDEDFISLIKDTLSTQAGVSMPEKYFQVRREEASDGKFYSKIDALDWDSLL